MSYIFGAGTPFDYGDMRKRRIAQELPKPKRDPFGDSMNAVLEALTAPQEATKASYGGQAMAGPERGSAPPVSGAAGNYSGEAFTPDGDPTLSLIREFEGFRETPYWDVNAYRTGYGSDTITTADGRIVPVAQGMTVSREDAERDLQRRVNTEFGPRAASAVGDAWGNLNPNQRAALTSITYNYGRLPSSVAAAVQSGDPRAVAQAINALGVHNDGINARRRAREAAIFMGQA